MIRIRSFLWLLWNTDLLIWLFLHVTEIVIEHTHKISQSTNFIHCIPLSVSLSLSPSHTVSVSLSRSDRQPHTHTRARARAHSCMHTQTHTHRDTHTNKQTNQTKKPRTHAKHLNIFLSNEMRVCLKRLYLRNRYVIKSKFTQAWVYVCVPAYVWARCIWALSQPPPPLPRKKR